MSKNDLKEKVFSTYRHLINNCGPETVTAPKVMGFLDMAGNYLSAIDTEANEAEVMKMRVSLRNAASTLLKHADWIGADAQQALFDFVREQPEFMLEGGYIFTHDYFSANIEQWRKDLNHFAGLPNLNFLEVGSFEGRSACWLLQNILTHETSRLTCVDVFDEERSQGLYDTTGLDSDSASKEDRFEHNVLQTGARYRVEKIKQWSREALRRLPGSFYDFIYIDGSHIARDVLEDAVLAWYLLKEGGLITFDDYMWKDNSDPLQCPNLAIDGFLNVYEGHYWLVHTAYQVTLRKLS